MTPILVISDDLSGAAEVAAIAAARGLSTEVQRQFDATTSARVIALDTDSRGVPAEVAANRLSGVAVQVGVHSARIFKKVDSVLRGHLRAEIEALLTTFNFQRAILIPANPSRGRTVARGRYFMNGIPLHQTDFATDEDFPRRSHEISELLDADGGFPIHVAVAIDRLPNSGIIVPDAASTADLALGANSVDESTLASGAADFFAAMLDRWCHGSVSVAQSLITPPFARPALLVCGSRAAWSQRRTECIATALPVIYPDSNFDIDTASARLRESGAVVLATQDTLLSREQRQSFLATLARSAATLTQAAAPATILLEGGATAAAVVSELGWKRFSVEPAAAPGIGFLKPINDPDAPLLLIKPGSYAWPPEIWQSFCRGAKA